MLSKYNVLSVRIFINADTVRAAAFHFLCLLERAVAVAGPDLYRGFPAGLVLASFGYFFIAEPMTLVLLLLAGLLNMLMFSIGRKMFDLNGLRVRRNISGFLTYTLAYSVFLQPAFLLGYLSELVQ